MAIITKLSKTDFLEYLQCPKCLWLKKKKPELYVAPVFTGFKKSKFEVGHEVERYARELFPKGILLNGDFEKLLKDTKELIASKKSPIFQATFISNRNLLVKIDVLIYNEQLNSWDIYEVKSSSKIKTDREHNHIKDVTFQKLVLKEIGINVGDVFIIHLNKDYKRKGDLNIKELFTITNVSEDIDKACDITSSEITEALSLLSKDDIDLNSCSCLYLARKNHCCSFNALNPNVPEYSVHDISRIHLEKIKSLIDSGVMNIKDISDNFELTENQRIQVNLEKSQKALINKDNIQESLKKLDYPLCFIDYETYSTAIPILDDISPHQHIPFQVSIHVLDSNSNLKHFEYLAKEASNAILGLIEFMNKTITPKGTIISWHASFEKTKNKEMAERYPEHSHFLFDLNSRTFDLEKFFKKDYLLSGFKGKTSIKNVLPVLIPEFSYENLDIQDGSEAMEQWGKMIFSSITEDEKQKIINNLLEYCKMDTLAMVEIFKLVRSS